MPFRRTVTLACSLLIASTTFALGGQSDNAPMPSPPATANVTLGGKAISIQYNAPSLRGRHIGSPDFIPYDKWWRTGANPATTLVTPVNLKIGTLTVPAGTYTIYTVPSATQWQLIINKQTGQWGTEYNQNQDLGRTPMMAKPMSSPQEVMSISFENSHGKSTELHIRWEKSDEYVPVTAE
jgi:hypothetical protein